MCYSQAKQPPQWCLAYSCQSICGLCLGPCGWVLKSPYDKMFIAFMVGKWQVDYLPTAF